MDVVAGGHEAGIEIGEVIDHDMIVVPVSEALQPAIVGAPRYLARHPAQEHPRDLTDLADLARTFARGILQMTQGEFSAAFKGSPMKGTKLRGLKRNAAVVLGNIGAPDDIDVLAGALEDDEPLVRGHAVWALGRLAARTGTPDA